MTRAACRLAACLLCIGVGLSVGPAVAAGESLLFERPLVVSGVPSESEEVAAAEAARRSSPEAVSAREASRTQYENLSAEQALTVAGEAFPRLIDEPAGGPPSLPAGESITGYASGHAAQVTLPGGRHGVIESPAPLAVEASPGQWVPVDLALSDVGGAFEPKTTAVGVRIPKRLGEGVSLASGGVSLTPVAAQGAALGGSGGMLDGAGVLYANTLTDADTLVKPTSQGFQADTLLRSVDSPEQLYFHVGLPEGASLQQASDGSGAVAVVEAGEAVTFIAPPQAWDAEGTVVPASMSVSGDTLVVSVPHSGSYRYPIMVDPTVIDRTTGYPWSFATLDEEAFSNASNESVKAIEIIGPHKTGQGAAFSYLTQGESRIERYRATTRSSLSSEDASTYMVILHEHYESEKLLLPTTEGSHEVSATKELTDGNTAGFLLVASSESGAEKGLSEFVSPEVTISQEAAPHVSLNTTAEVVGGEENALYGSRWSSATAGGWGIEADASDPGLGVQLSTASSPSALKWRSSIEGACNGVQCRESATPVFALKSSIETLPEGEDSVEVKVKDPVGLEASSGVYKLKIDNTPPHGITLSGLPADQQIGEREYNLKAEATDGSGSTPSSGMRSIALAVDGHAVGKAEGSCSPGPCTAGGEWQINGGEFGAGEHKLQVTATDNAGNAATTEYAFKVHHASPLSLGPGSVGPVSGQFELNATDVAVSAPGSGLTVSRGYYSRNLTAGTGGPLGPQWALSVGGEESLTVLGSSVSLQSAGGGKATFTSNGKGGFASPTGDANLALAEVKNAKAEVTEFTLKDEVAGTTVRFTPPGVLSRLWKPAKEEGPLAAETVRYLYQTVEGVTEPVEALAPEASGVSCGSKVEELKAGCRALTFKYASATTATGESESEWGEYKGRLSQIVLHAYNPSSKAMEEKTVAQYAYDKQGRLRAEWDPRVSPALKTVYGYDAEGHVTALTPPGQQTWAFTYGTGAGDLNPGRLLKVMRPPATTPLWAGEAPKSTEAPKLTGTPKPGVRMAVSNGVWANSPVTYGYQWEDCNAEGTECVPIAGATNANYTPAESDVGHTLVAEVSAVSGGGSVVASTAASTVVSKTGTATEGELRPPAAGSTVEYHVPVSGTGLPTLTMEETEKWGQKDAPSEGVAIFPPDEPQGWPAGDYKHASIVYLDEEDHAVNTYAPTGGISTTEYNEFNDVARTLSADNRAAALKEGCKSKSECRSAEVSKLLDFESTYNTTGSEPGTQLLETLGPQHTVKLAQGKEKAGEEVLARDHVKYSYNEGAPAEGGPYDLVTKTVDAAETASKEEFDKHESTVSYAGQENLGWKLRKATSTTTDPNGLKLTRTTAYDASSGNVTETTMPAGRGEPPLPLYREQFGSLGSEAGQLESANSVSVDAGGDVWVSDAGNNRVEEFSATGSFIRAFGWGVSNGKAEPEVCTSGCQAGIAGAGKGQLSNPQGVLYDANNGHIYVADANNNRIDVFSAEGAFLKAWGWGVVNSKEELQVCTTMCTSGLEGAGNGEMKTPHGLGVGPAGNIWVADLSNDRLDVFGAEGAYVATYGKEGHGNGEFSGANDVTYCNGDMYAVDDAGRVQELSGEGKYVAQFGKAGKEPGQFGAIARIACDPKNNDLYVTDRTSDDVNVYTASGAFVGAFGSEGTGGGQLKTPIGVAVASTGTAYVVDSANNRIERWSPGLAAAHTTQTIYYSAGANSQYPGCGSHPEWANLPCQTQPAEQPGTNVLPNLPVTAYKAYNLLDELETETETVGASTRTTTTTYDAAGRAKSRTISSTVGTALPAVNTEYNSETGMPEKQSTTSEGKTKTITSAYNTLGQLVSYTDAGEATTTYEYDIDGRLTKVNDGKGIESFTYSETTGLLSELLNEYGTSKLLFTATYDPEGNMLTEGYPNGMSAKYAYDQVGAPVGLEYVKTTHCSEKCAWFSDTVVPSIHGQWLEQTSTLSHQSYTYDAAGRLTEVQNTPAGKGCTTRIYAYDEDTNRTSLTTREPNAKGECASEGGTAEKHGYDTADRLTDPGIAYSTFGDITALPASDAGGKEASEELTSSYYVDNQVASQTQAGQTIGYELDPAGRTIETVATGKKVANTALHYAGPGSSPAWTSNSTGETTRNIAGINGQLAAIQNNAETPELQLSNLHGDIIAKAYLSETATGLASTADTSEFGVPTVSLPTKYSWLGAVEIPTELSSGVAEMGVRSYVPQIGRFLQPDPVPGGSANAYAYTFGNPVNTSDTSGETTALELLWGFAEEAGHAAEAAREAARLAAEEAAARAAAEAAAQAAFWASGRELLAEWSNAWAGSGGEEEEWYEEEGGEYEEAAYHHDGPSGEEPRIEPALLIQSLPVASGSETGSTPESVVPLCVAGSERPCGREAKGKEGEKCGSMYGKPCHHGGKEGKAEAHIELAVLYQSLGETTLSGEASSEGAPNANATVPLCKVGSQGPCARDTAYCYADGRCHGAGRVYHQQGRSSGGGGACDRGGIWAGTCGHVVSTNSGRQEGQSLVELGKEIEMVASCANEIRKTGQCHG